MTRYDLGAIHGRFQPLHTGHFDYLLSALDRALTVIIGITNPFGAQGHQVDPTDDHRHLASSNPLTYFERVELITCAIARFDSELLARVRIVPFDLTASDWTEAIPKWAVQIVTAHEPWDLEKARRFAAAGYHVDYLPLSDDRVTATAVRESLHARDDSWRKLVPPGCAEALERLLTYNDWRRQAIK